MLVRHCAARWRGDPNSQAVQFKIAYTMCIAARDYVYSCIYRVSGTDLSPLDRLQFGDLKFIAAQAGDGGAVGDLANRRYIEQLERRCRCQRRRCRRRQSCSVIFSLLRSRSGLFFVRTQLLVVGVGRCQTRIASTTAVVYMSAEIILTINFIPNSVSIQSSVFEDFFRVSRERASLMDLTFAR